MSRLTSNATQWNLAFTACIAVCALAAAFWLAGQQMRAEADEIRCYDVLASIQRLRAALRDEQVYDSLPAGSTKHTLRSALTRIERLEAERLTRLTTQNSSMLALAMHLAPDFSRAPLAATNGSRTMTIRADYYIAASQDLTALEHSESSLLSQRLEHTRRVNLGLRLILLTCIGCVVAQVVHAVRAIRSAPVYIQASARSALAEATSDIETASTTTGD